MPDVFFLSVKVTIIVTFFLPVLLLSHITLFNTDTDTYVPSSFAHRFASRQDQNHPETWMSSKCTCPLCRSCFCMLDVCQVQSR
jgi:hypothetical protein